MDTHQEAASDAAGRVRRMRLSTSHPMRLFAAETRALPVGDRLWRPRRLRACQDYLEP